MHPPLAILLTPGQAGDAPMMLPLLAHLRVLCTIGRLRTRPQRVLADKASSSRALRAHLRTRGIGSVIPESDDQKAHRKRVGSSGGRPVTYDRTAYRGRIVIVYRGGLVLAAVLLWLTDFVVRLASSCAVLSALPAWDGATLAGQAPPLLG